MTSIMRSAVTTTVSALEDCANAMRVDSASNKNPRSLIRIRYLLSEIETK
jgi:hypothetical protein